MSLLEKLKADLEGFKTVKLEDVGEFVKVTVEYQAGQEGKDRWTAINKLVKQYGGEWVSLGSKSHWKVPKEQRFTTVTPLKESPYYQAIQEIKKILENLE